MMAVMKRIVLAALFFCALAVGSRADDRPDPVPLIFDTDIGNDCDDVLALGMIHALQSRGECRLLAVTITKDEDQAAAFTDCVNTFYGRGNIPVGVCRSGITPQPGRFVGLARKQDNGRDRYPHDLRSGRDAPDAVALLRRTLAAQEDGSVVIVQVGFSTNLAGLLASPADQSSDLDGTALVKQKVRLLSIMAGAFQPIPGPDGRPVEHLEYNVVQDLPSAKRLADTWPTPIVWSGYEIGLALPYPHQSILHDYDYVDHHPLAEAYTVYSPPPHNRPTWDLTAVLHAVRPRHHYFDLSAPGQVTVEDNGRTAFRETAGGRDRFLILTDAQKARVLEALVLLSSQPPAATVSVDP